MEEGNKAATLETDPSRPKRGYEYLDHTADVQLHAWGSDLSAAFEECAKAMFGYMTGTTGYNRVHLKSLQLLTSSPSQIDSIKYYTYDFLFQDLDTVSECKTESIRATGSDLENALFSFLDEWLFLFSAEPFFIPFKIDVTAFERKDGEVVIEANGFGETFDLEKHPQGTEVKAITYSAMQINEKPDFAEVFVIIDI